MKTKISASQLFPSGAWELSAIVGNQLIRKAYYGYGKREAMRMFRFVISKAL